MSLFNAEQEGHRRYLASIPPTERCWCGWCLAGECDTPVPCPSGYTLADAIRTKMPCCGRPAARPDFPTTTGSHYSGCCVGDRDPMLIDLGVVDLGGES